MPMLYAYYKELQSLIIDSDISQTQTQIANSTSMADPVIHYVYTVIHVVICSNFCNILHDNSMNLAITKECFMHIHETLPQFNKEVPTFCIACHVKPM